MENFPSKKIYFIKQKMQQLEEQEPAEEERLKLQNQNVQGARLSLQEALQENSQVKQQKYLNDAQAQESCYCRIMI